MIYFPTGKATTLNLSDLKGSSFNSWWYDPRTGAVIKGETLEKSNNLPVTPPAEGIGNDWVLVIDAADSGFAKPGE